MQERLLDKGLAAIDVPDALAWHYVPRERSSLLWVLHRKYRGGLQDGMAGWYNEVAARAPVAELGRSAASVVKRGVLLDWAGFWQAVAATFYWTGVLRGARRAARGLRGGSVSRASSHLSPHSDAHVRSLY